jgi:citronellyl-CoA dehydrogenase
LSEQFQIGSGTTNPNPNPNPNTATTAPIETLPPATNPDTNAATAALAKLPEEAGIAEIWAALGAAGVLRDVYRDSANLCDLHLDPHRLRDLLGQVDARRTTGLTLSVCVQIATALPLLATESGPVVRAALERALAGDAITALAATDAAASGSDLAGMGTTIQIGEHNLMLTGAKNWVTNATTCDQILVLARHRPGRHFTAFSWVLVPRDAPGVRAEAADTPLFDGSGVGHLTFESVRLSREHVVGRVGRGMASFGVHITRERLAGALWAVQFGRRVLAETHERLAARQSGEQSLWSYDTVRHRYAEALVELALLDALTAAAGRTIAEGYAPAEAALLKAAAARGIARVLERCAVLEGADGFLRGRAQQLRAEAAVFGIGGGTTDLMLSAVAEHAAQLLEGVR